MCIMEGTKDSNQNWTLDPLVMNNEAMSVEPPNHATGNCIGNQCEAVSNAEQNDINIRKRNIGEFLHRNGSSDLRKFSISEDNETDEQLYTSNYKSAAMDKYPEDTLFVARDIKKSMSFGGYGLLPGQTEREVTFAELKLLVEEGKKEPTKTTKQKIKEFAARYKDFKYTEGRRMPWYKELVQQSQLAHLITIISVVSMAFRLCPDSRRSPAEASTLTRLIYIGTISIVFGSEFWMTFVSGLALFFSVPRHIFAQVQVVLFPLYFLLKSVLLLLALFAYTQHRPTHTWNTSQFIQGTLLAVGFIVNLAIRLYLSPPLISLITIKMAIEKEEGLGGEVGDSSPGRLLHCPHYMKLHRAFRRIHAMIAVGNVISMATTSLHLYNLAIELCAVR
uniref:Transmembrane protein 205-like n=1 Tax=Hirondellea gigas TaxID=1518452 RepID=A0A2P2I6B1_9CRUS